MQKLCESGRAEQQNHGHPDGSMRHRRPPNTRKSFYQLSTCLFLSLMGRKLYQLTSMVAESPIQSSHVDVTGWHLTTPLHSSNHEKNESNSLDTISSVDYIACCGLGHRLARMAAANVVAQQTSRTLRSHWGWCGGDDGVVEIYSSLYAPPKLNVSSSHQTGTRIRFMNTVNGFQTIQRSKKQCACDDAKIQSDYEFYSDLRRRFIDQRTLHEYRERHFDQRFVFGIHVRAGNGEGGDFARKRREIANQTTWVDNVSRQIMSLVQNINDNVPGPLLYVATDTPSIIDLFRDRLKESMPVVHWMQTRMDAGEGVFFGGTGDISNKDSSQGECLRRWKDAIMDMMLLSYADVVISGRPSSFAQTLPMSLAFQQQKRYSLIHRPYCEIIGNEGTNMTCYSSYKEWCCKYDSWLDKEFVQFAPPGKEIPTLKILARPDNRMVCYPRPGRRAKQWCLPHRWKPIV